MRKFLLTTIAATMLAGAGVASADTQKLGKIAAGTVESFNSIVENGKFNDIFKFNLGANSGSSYSVIDFRVPGYNVRFGSLSLYSNDDGKIGSVDDHLLFSTIEPSGKGLSFSMDELAAGKYYLMVSGQGLGKLGGLYNGAIGVSAPVPEPESYAMMLAGLGLMGTIARRRSKSKAV